MAFNVGLLVEKNVDGDGIKRTVTSVTEHRGFREVEQIDIATGWRQILAGRWRGVGLLEVLEPQQYTWGKQIIIAELGRDRRKLQEHYPGLMIFTPAEFRDAVEHWPDNEGVILAKRIFNGEIMGFEEAREKENGRGVA